jgi:hypothetical protein
LSIERFFEEMDLALKVLSGVAPTLRESPSQGGDGDPLMSSSDKSKSIALIAPKRFIPAKKYLKLILMCETLLGRLRMKSRTT